MILFCPVLRHFINLIIGSCSDDDYQHFCFCPDQLIHDTDTGIPDLDFQESSQIIALLISQRLSIAALCNRQRILKDFADDFQQNSSDLLRNPTGRPVSRSFSVYLTNGIQSILRNTEFFTEMFCRDKRSRIRLCHAFRCQSQQPCVVYLID